VAYGVTISMADQNLFINLFKRLAPGRAAGGVFDLTASGGKGGEATLGKNTLKAGCECAFPLVPRGKSHSPLRQNSFKNNSEGLFVKLFKRFPMIALIIEMTGDHLPSVSMELMELALRLKNRRPSKILALVYGKESEKGARWFAGESGVETLGLVWENSEHSGMATAAALEKTLKKRRIHYLLFSHTPSAMEIAPALAVALGLPMVSGVVEFDGDPGTFYRSAGGGKSRLHVDASPGAVVTLQPGALTATVPEAALPGSVTTHKLHMPSGPARILATHTRQPSSTTLSGARVVVSVGRGIEAKENLPLFARFACALPGSAKACSRPLVDMGWMPYPCQVGITGTAVSADLYIALGISGSTQHLAGIPQSTTVVSINRDPNAAIHAVSDLIIEADLLPFIEAVLTLITTAIIRYE